MKHILAFILMVSAQSAMAPSAMAQDGDWRYTATLYGWFPGLSASVDTRFGTVTGDASSSDALENLDMAFMGTFAAQRGRWGLGADLLYVDLSATQPTPFALFGDATVKTKVTALSGYFMYRLTQDPAVAFDLGAGFRSFDLDLDVALGAGVAPAESEGLSRSWTDPLLAARVYVPINEKWFAEGFGDFGGTGSDDETWQLYGAVGYRISENWSAKLGYRTMNISKDVDSRAVSLDLRGALLAFAYDF